MAALRIIPSWLAAVFALLGVIIIACGLLGYPRYDAVLRTGWAEAGGYAYNVQLPPPTGLLALFTYSTDVDTGTGSKLRLYENGRELGPPHSLHDDIRHNGGGRFSHWGTEMYLSATDNTNPALNGRTYTTQTPLGMPMWGWILGAVLLVLGGARIVLGAVSKPA